MELLRAENVGEIESNPVKKCRACNEELKLVRAVMIPPGNLIRMFECKCGERIWEE
jgi:hypothetical protein